VALQEHDAVLNTEDKRNGIIKAMLDQSDISIKIAKIESRPTTIDIKSRRKGIPDLKTADFLSEQINAQLRQKL